MATNGKTVKTRTRVEKIVRKQKASLKQRVSWRKFKINGAAGFAVGSSGSCAHNIRRLAELGRHLGDKDIEAACRAALGQLGAVEIYVNHVRLMLLDRAEEAELAEEKYNATHNCNRT